MIPNCYDPVQQEEVRQNAWDRIVDDLPRCGCCRESVYPGDCYYEEKQLILCHRCMNRLQENEFILEV